MGVLKDRISDSTVTIVFVSSNIKELFVPDKKQWIPWEVSFSLKEHMSKDMITYTNSLLLIVLLDNSGSRYRYDCTSKFRILQANIDNGYAEVVRWDDFLNNPEQYVPAAE